MSNAVAKRVRWTPTEIDLGLVALIMVGGNSVKAAEGLEPQMKVTTSTLRQWKLEHPERYADLQQELAPKLAEKTAVEAEAFVIELQRAETAILERLTDKIDSLDAKELPGALRNVSTSKALQMDKIVNPLRGRPSVVTATVDATQLLASLARKVGVHFDVESTVESA